MSDRTHRPSSPLHLVEPSPTQEFHNKEASVSRERTPQARSLRGSVELRIDALQYNESLRRWVENCAGNALEASDVSPLAGQVAVMVTGELIGNAVDHGVWNPVPASLRLWLDWNHSPKGTVWIRVRNAVRDPIATFHRVEKLIAQTQSPDRARETARARVAELSRGAPSTSGTSGLGLINLGIEGACALAAVLHKPNILEVTAAVEVHRAESLR